MSKTLLIVDGDIALAETGRPIMIGQDPADLDDVELPEGVEAQPGTEGEVSAQIKVSQDVAEVLGTGYVADEGYGNKALDLMFKATNRGGAPRTLVGQAVQDAIVRLMDYQEEDLSKMTPGELIDQIADLVVLPGRSRKTDVAYYLRLLTQSGEHIRRAYNVQMGHQG